MFINFNKNEKCRKAYTLLLTCKHTHTQIQRCINNFWDDFVVAVVDVAVIIIAVHLGRGRCCWKANEKNILWENLMLKSNKTKAK